MNTYIIRPYYGYDCDSENGFNNGQYLDEIVVQADDENSARDLGVQQYFADNNLNVAEYDIDVVGAWVISKEYNHVWFDSEGNEYASESDIPEDTDTECYYRYEYIDFSDIRIADDTDFAEKPLTPFFVNVKGD